MAGCGANAVKAKASQQRQCGAFLLLFQEQIKGPENASIARFFGLCCYQTSSEISDAFRNDDGGCALAAAVMKGAPGEMLRDLAQPAARAGHWGHWRCACSLAARLAGCGANAAKADASQRPGACVLLLFCERIQGPENASIARFFGLCCYQTSSELTNCREPLLLAAGWLLRREVGRKGGERLHRTASGALLASGACLRSAPWAWQAASGICGGCKSSMGGHWAVRLICGWRFAVHHDFRALVFCGWALQAWSVLLWIR